MENKKEIVILSGGGHKGIVKLQGDLIRGETIKGSCNVDFRPTNAYLYLIGDNISKVALNDTNTTFEVPFRAKCEFGCAVRSSAITMFGGSISNGKIIKKIDEYNKQSTLKKPIKAQSIAAQNSQSLPPENQSQKPLTILDITDNKDRVKYDGNNFYYAVKPQIDELFICYPEEKALVEAVENSRWVRVDAQDESYVVGLLFENEEPAYLCYGMPAKTDAAPPPELDGACSWLPVSAEDGYWVIYQSAHSGEIIK